MVMDNHSTQLGLFPCCTEIPQAHGHNSFCSVEQTESDRIMEYSPSEGFFEFEWLVQMPYQSKQLSFSEFSDLENFSSDFNLPPLDDDFVVDLKPLNIGVPTSFHCKQETCTSGFGEASVAIENRFGEPSKAIEHGFSNSVKKEKEEIEEVSYDNSRKRTSLALEFDDIKMHFDVPITVAAKKMNVGLTLLKRRCRELKIKRWPHRKLKSLQALIHNVKEMGLTKEVEKLEKHIRLVEKLPHLELNEETKKLRQACFKANYKRRRSYLATSSLTFMDGHSL